MAKKQFNIEDSPAMRFVTESRSFKDFANVQREAAEHNAGEGEFVAESHVEVPATVEQATQILEQIPDQIPDTTLNRLEAATSDEKQISDQSTGQGTNPIKFVLPEPPELLTKTLSIKITQATYEEVKRRANERGVSMSKYAGEALKMVMNKIDV